MLRLKITINRCVKIKKSPGIAKAVVDLKKVKSGLNQRRNQDNRVETSYFYNIKNNNVIDTTRKFTTIRIIQSVSMNFSTF